MNSELRRWQQESLIQHEPFIYFNENEQWGGGFSLGNNDQGLGEALLMGRAMKPDPGLENEWNDDGIGRVLNFGNGSEFQMNCAIPRTASCPPDVAAAMAEVARNKGKESFRKRKSDEIQYFKLVDEEKSQEKCKTTEQSSNSKSTITAAAASSSSNKKGPSSDNNSKASESPKLDYIHVRARRGQATDSHSLAERVRREKISERMKYLQDLVPGCNKITGKAGMLDEIINYVHSLQRQVEFLSMKLAAINPPLDFDSDNYLAKEMFPACTSSVPTIGVTSEMVNPGQVQFNTSGQGVQCCSSLQMSINPPDYTLRRTISAPVPVPDTLLDSSCLNQNQFFTWNSELPNQYSMEYQQGRSTSFGTQPLTGYGEAGHVKLEM